MVAQDVAGRIMGNAGLGNQQLGLSAFAAPGRA
jgi:hypothetical protein